MKRILYILLIILSVGSQAFAQDFVVEQETTTPSGMHNHAEQPQVRYVRVAGDEDAVMSHRDSVRVFYKPDAMRAVWMGAIIPGYGQIYNRSYWKLPIVYGAFFGCAYAITWTNGMYTDYKTAYRDIYTDIQAGTVTEDASKSYIAILPSGYSLTQVGGASKWQSTLQNRQNSYRRYRDISIVASVLVYALSLVDAYVDAQLFDFDITDDLSMTIEPTINRDIMNNTTGEMRLAFAF